MARILVIDDEEPIRTLLRSVLEGARHEVLDVPDGQLALTVYREKPVDVVITDIIMPKMSGLALIEELTRAFLNVKVIAISGAGDIESNFDAAKLLGVRYTFSKPFNMDALLKAVQYELTH